MADALGDRMSDSPAVTTLPDVLEAVVNTASPIRIDQRWRRS